MIDALFVGTMRIKPVDGIVDLKIDDRGIVMFLECLYIFFQRQIAASADLVMGIGEMDEADLVFTKSVIVHLKIFPGHRHGDQVDADLQIR